MANSAGNVPGGNEGQTDTGRGQSGDFSSNKSQRNTGRTGSVGSEPNSNTEDGNKSVVSDPRTTTG